VNRAFEKGVLLMPGAPGLINGVSGDHIALSPPFTITEPEVDEIVRVIRETLVETATSLGY
jgi:adenosylmethionine-8-amino-7-oxononanoate aminotransferase